MLKLRFRRKVDLLPEKILKIQQDRPVVYFVITNSKTMSGKNLQQYWKTNLKYLVILLIIWFVVSYGFGILLSDQLNQIRIGGFKLGFWFAQQGAIYTFVILIFIYVGLMNKLDKQYDVDEK